MAATLPATGPAFFYVGVGQSRCPFFLGTAEGVPRIQKQKAYKPWYTDTSTGGSPHDYQYMGEEAVVSVVLNRWDGTVYRRLTQAPRHQSLARIGPGAGGFATLAAGQTTRYERGALMISQGLAARLWIAYPYNGIVPGTAGPVPTLTLVNNLAQGMPIGYYFPAVFLVGDEDEPGSQVETLPLAFKCASAYVPLQGNFFTNVTAQNRGGFTLYSMGPDPAIVGETKTGCVEPKGEPSREFWLPLLTGSTADGPFKVLPKF